MLRIPTVKEKQCTISRQASLTYSSFGLLAGRNSGFNDRSSLRSCLLVKKLSGLTSSCCRREGDGIRSRSPVYREPSGGRVDSCRPQFRFTFSKGLNHCPSKKIAAGACSVAQTHPNSIVTSACVVCYAWPLSTSVTTGVAVPLMKGQA